ncbi:MAG: ATP-binding cassette domain-containing protein [Lachnospiraceae bacterium]|nr:ATP-binding cassette domain-containing protein [Lachnospiraceae bacterium]
MFKFNQFKKIWNQLNYILNKEQKKESVWIVIMLFIGSFAEMLGVSFIIPFVQALLNPELLMKNKVVSSLLDTLSIKGEMSFLIFLGIVLIAIYVFKNVFLTFSLYERVKYQCKVKKEISVEIMRACMNREYSFYLNINTGELIRKTYDDVVGDYYLLSNIFKLFAETMTTLVIGVFILFTDFTIALSIIVIAAVTLAAFTIGTHKKIEQIGKDNLKYNTDAYQHMMQAYSGIKEIMVMRRQDYFLGNYQNAYEDKSRTEKIQNFINEVPAYIIESVCVSGLIGVICFRISTGMQPINFVPQLAAFAVAAFRILPSVARIVSAFNSISYFQPSLESTYEIMHELEKYEEHRNDERTNEGITEKWSQGIAEFKKNLLIENLSFKYPNTEKYVLKNLNLVIGKGESVAFIGESGAGKSTLADVILGLFEPEEGYIKMDDINVRTMPESWSKLIGYVPQTIFLSNDSIKANVAFGIKNNEIVEEKVWEALEQSQLKEFVETLPEGINTILGERGIKFSGGQRQRIAIARALYNNPEILLLDEATSALDNETEKAVMEAIDSLRGHKTLIIVAHRLSTIRNCDTIYEIANGKAIKKDKIDLFEKK